MPTLQFKPGETPHTLSPIALERLARYAAEACEARSIVAQVTGDAELTKEVQNVHDLAESLVYRLTGKPLPSSCVGPMNQGGR